jgi:uncharacterized protein YcnI
MRVNLMWSLLSVVCLTLVATGVAWAHTTVSPKEVPAGSTETFTVRAPGEKDVPIVRERVEIPEGFEVTEVPATSGWESELEHDASGANGAIVWSGGEIPPDEAQEFAFEARTPDEPGEFRWRAFDTYEDGSVAEWTGPENSEEPASVVRVVQEGARVDGSGAEPEEHGHESTSEEKLPGSGGIDPLIFYGGLGIGGLALALALATVLVLRRGST